MFRKSILLAASAAALAAPLLALAPAPAAAERVCYPGSTGALICREIGPFTHHQIRIPKIPPTCLTCPGPDLRLDRLRIPLGPNLGRIDLGPLQPQQIR